MRIVGWVATGLAIAAVVGAVVSAANSSSDVKRYMRMRRM